MVVPEVTLVLSTHKSGTYVSWAIYGKLCCPPLLQVREDQPGKLGGGLFACKASCERQHVWLSNNGLHSKFNLTTNSLVVHLARHPVDLLLSGFSYHRACNEPAWTDQPGWLMGMQARSWVDVASARHWFGDERMRERIGALLGAANNETSYCRGLQRSDEATGLQAEAARLRSVAFRGTLVPICLAHLNPYEPLRARAAWARIARSLNVTIDQFSMERHFARHRSHGSCDEKARLRVLARNQLAQLSEHSLGLSRSPSSPAEHAQQSMLRYRLLLLRQYMSGRKLSADGGGVATRIVRSDSSNDDWLLGAACSEESEETRCR
jgi:hypothetical protein